MPAPCGQIRLPPLLPVSRWLRPLCQRSRSFFRQAMPGIRSVGRVTPVPAPDSARKVGAGAAPRRRCPPSVHCHRHRRCVTRTRSVAEATRKRVLPGQKPLPANLTASALPRPSRTKTAGVPARCRCEACAPIANELHLSHRCECPGNAWPDPATIHATLRVREVGHNEAHVRIRTPPPPPLPLPPLQVPWPSLSPPPSPLLPRPCFTCG